MNELANDLLCVIAAFRRYMDANDENGFDMITKVPSRKKIDEQLEKYQEKAYKALQEPTDNPVPTPTR